MSFENIDHFTVIYHLCAGSSRKLIIRVMMGKKTADICMTFLMLAINCCRASREAPIFKYSVARSVKENVWMRCAKYKALL